MSADRASRGVDFHCHLDLGPDPYSAVARAEARRVYTLTVTMRPSDWPRNVEMTRNTRYVRAALGLHPRLVAGHAAEISLWENYFPETRYIGEVGLDAGVKFRDSLDAQEQVFRTVLERCAEAGGKILSVHSVRCVPDVLDMIERHLPRNCGVVVLHWFEGTATEAQRAAALGCYFSVNARMACNERGRSVVATLPDDRILTETDAPFTQVDGRDAEPGDIPVVVESIARVRGVSVEALTETIYKNFRTLLQSGRTSPPW